MKTSLIDFDPRPAEIGYFPCLACPQCGAAQVPDERGRLFIPFQDLFGSALQCWEGYFGYVRFACACPQQPGPGMRVARLGDALLPLPFVAGSQEGLPGDVLNARRVARAVNFLSRHADPARLAPPDALREVLIALATGGLGVEQAEARIRALQTEGLVQPMHT